MFYITFDKGEDGPTKTNAPILYPADPEGVFFTPFHHAYISFRHTQADLDLALIAIDESLAFVKAKYQ